VLAIIEYRLFLQPGAFNHCLESRPRLAHIWKLQPRESGILRFRFLNQLVPVLTDVLADLTLSGEILCFHAIELNF
jgi:hypothetical protein